MARRPAIQIGDGESFYRRTRTSSTRRGQEAVTLGLTGLPDRGAALRPHLRRAAARADLRPRRAAARRPRRHDDARPRPAGPVAGRSSSAGSPSSRSISNSHNGAIDGHRARRRARSWSWSAAATTSARTSRATSTTCWRRNSPGSTFKPFVYLTTFVKLGWGPGTMIQDTPVSFRESDGTVFSPDEPEQEASTGRITIRNALGNSLNIPAFKAALRSRRRRRSSTFGEEHRLHGLDGAYGPAIAIGGVDLKALDLTYGYSVLANGGVMAGQDTFAPTTADERTCRADRHPQGRRPRGQRALRRRRAPRAAAGRPPRARLPDHGHPHRPERPVHHLRLRRPQRPRLQGRREDRHQRALRPDGPQRAARSARPGPSATRRTSSSASGPATRTTRRSSTSSARRSPTGRCATSCSRRTRASGDALLVHNPATLRPRDRWQGRRGARRAPLLSRLDEPEASGTA